MNESLQPAAQPAAQPADKSSYSSTPRFFRTDTKYGSRTVGVRSGSPFRSSYIRHIDIGGASSLEQSDSVDVNEVIQLNAKGNQLCDLVSRFLRGDRGAIGDVDSLVFEDLTNAPKDVCEVAEKLARVRERFDQLPLDVRSKYNHDLMSYLKAASDGTMKKEIDDASKSKREAHAARVKELRDKFTDEQLSKLASIIGGSK